MQFEQIVETLEAWSDRYHALHNQLDALKSVLRFAPEAPLINEIYETWSAYNRAISALVGDKYEWLDWFEFECKMGKQTMSYFKDGEEFEVKTIQDLAKLITDTFDE
jgi:hypothetical protein